MSILFVDMSTSWRSVLTHVSISTHSDQLAEARHDSTDCFFITTEYHLTCVVIVMATQQHPVI